MPYTADTVPDHVPADQAEAWAKTWNAAYASCQKRKGDDCEGYAFRVANAMLKKTREGAMERQDRDELKRAQARRAKASGIAPKPGGNLTRPSGYSDCPDSNASWGDWTNYRYPLAPQSRATNAITRFNNKGNQAKGGYTGAEWAKIGGRIAAKNPGKVYKAGQVVDAERSINLTEYISKIRRAFDEAFPHPYGEPSYWVRDVYDDYVVVEGLPGDDFSYYRVTYTDQGGQVTFAARPAWQGGGFVFQEGARAYSGFRVLRARDGTPWWIGWSASAYRALDQMYIATDALKADVARREGKSRGPLLVAHVPGLRLGDCLFGAVAGRILVEAGPFDDTPLARAAVPALEAMDEPLAMSIQWSTPLEGLNGDTFEDVHILERSILEVGREADLVTQFSTVREAGMDWKKAFAQKLGIATEVIDEALEGAEDLSHELDEAGVPSRAAPDEAGETREEGAEGGAETLTPQQFADMLAGAVEAIGAVVSQSIKEALEGSAAAQVEATGRALEAQLNPVIERLGTVERAVNGPSEGRRLLWDALAHRASNAPDTVFDPETNPADEAVQQNGTVGRPAHLFDKARA